jgi:hypothetical protein
MLSGDHRKSFEAFGSGKLGIPNRPGGTAKVALTYICLVA